MKISIKLLSKEAPVVLEVPDDATLEELTEAVQENEGISTRQQQAVFKRNRLEDTSRQLSEYNIVDGSTVVILVSDKLADETEVKVPIDRCFDVQWNPPGVPTLSCSGLSTPYKDRLSNPPPQEGDSYMFKEVGPEKVSFVRVRPSGEEILVFGHCVWVSFNGEVLHFEGDGSYGTLIKGIGVAAGSEDGAWSGTHKPDHVEVMKWLRLNFAQEEKVEVSNSNLPHLNGIYTVDPDNQIPARRFFRHGQPFGKCYRKAGTNRTLWPDREGNWCLAENYRYNDTTGETGNLYDSCPAFPWEAKFRRDIIVKLVED